VRRSAQDRAQTQLGAEDLVYVSLLWHRHGSGAALGLSPTQILGQKTETGERKIGVAKGHSITRLVKNGLVISVTERGFSSENSKVINSF
jgi:hypothetical protein